jgi:ABC-type proline/glycine betaine transport system ATPase subunit
VKNRFAVLERGHIVQVDELDGLRRRPATLFIEALFAQPTA